MAIDYDKPMRYNLYELMEGGGGGGGGGDVELKTVNGESLKGEGNIVLIAPGTNSIDDGIILLLGTYSELSFSEEGGYFYIHNEEGGLLLGFKMDVDESVVFNKNKVVISDAPNSEVGEDGITLQHANGSRMIDTFGRISIFDTDGIEIQHPFGVTISDVNTPVGDSDAANKKYVDDNFSGLVKIASGSKSNVSWAANEGKTLEFTGIVPDGYEILGFRNVVLTGENRDSLRLQTFSTSGQGRNAQIRVVNEGNYTATATVQVNVSVIKSQFMG